MASVESPKCGRSPEAGTSEGGIAAAVLYTVIDGSG